MFSIICPKTLGFLCQPFFSLILIVPSLPLFSLPLQRRWWPGGKWCRDRYLTLRWRRAPCPAWARWQASRPPRSPINSSWLISISWAPCCPHCISWGDWGRGRWLSRQRWAESWLQDRTILILGLNSKILSTKINISKCICVHEWLIHARWNFAPSSAYKN